MPTDLTALLSLELGDTDALDWFIGSCLHDGCVWASPRTSDGIAGIDRVLERTPDRLRLHGRVYEIDQTLHPFWFELVRDVGDRFAWFLYFDLAERSPRRAPIVTTYERAEDIEWRAKLAGEAIVEDGVFAIVPGSTRAQIRDPREPDNRRGLPG